MDVSSLSNHYCSTDELKNSAYDIRYHAYLQKGYIEADEGPLFSDNYDQMPNNHTFVLKDGDRPIASMRISILRAQPGWDDIPVKPLFPETFVELEKQYDTIVELNRLTVLPDVIDFQTLVPMSLFVNAMHLLPPMGNVLVICAARKSHKRFYERLRFKKITDYKPYPTLKFDTAMFACVWNLETDFDGFPLADHFESLSPKLSKKELEIFSALESMATS